MNLSIETSAPQIVLEELNHRFLNSLQIISTLAASQSEGGGSAEQLLRLARLRGCIAALGRLHRLLALPLNMPIEDAIVEISGALTEAFGRAVAISVSVSDEPDDPALARALLLLLAELVTNALKHARTQPLVVGIELTHAFSGWCLRVGSNTHANASSPRVATALAEWLGGKLLVDASTGFTVTVMIPDGDAEAPSLPIETLVLTSEALESL